MALAIPHRSDDHCAQYTEQQSRTESKRRLSRVMHTESDEAGDQRRSLNLLRMRQKLDRVKKNRDMQRQMRNTSSGNFASASAVPGASADTALPPSDGDAVGADSRDADDARNVAIAIFSKATTAPAKDDQTIRASSVFKRPRRTTCSDARQSYEMVNEAILARMDEDEQSRYMSHMFAFFQDVDTYGSVMEARTRFFQYAEPFMLPDELRGFTQEAEKHRKSEHWASSTSSGSSTSLRACGMCGSPGTEFDLDEKRAEASCRKCGSVVTYAVTSDKYLPYGIERPTAPCPYRRSSHFTELLNALQGKHQQGIPEHVMERIHKELRKQRITDVSILDRQRMRRLMKGARLNEYYSYIQAILARLQERQPPTISMEVEAELKSMFAKVQDSFDRVIKDVMPSRRNYLSYSVLLYRFFQLLELDEYLEHVQLLTTRSKLAEQDRIWKAICEDLQWRFIAIV